MVGRVEMIKLGTTAAFVATEVTHAHLDREGRKVVVFLKGGSVHSSVFKTHEEADHEFENFVDDMETFRRAQELRGVR